MDKKKVDREDKREAADCTPGYILRERRQEVVM